MCHRKAGPTGIPKFFFLSVTSFSCLWVTGYASTLSAQTGVQWLATPLSQADPYWTRLQGVIKPLNSALHGIEPTTSRSSAQRLDHQTTVVVFISLQMCVYILKNIWKCHRNWKFEISKNWPSRESNPGLPSHIWWSYH